MNDTNQNPYVGPRKFETNESHLFYGREREALDLLSLVISERLVLFYAQSGAGKSSLINTKLIPGLLAEEEYRVLPVGRMGAAESFSENDVGNIYIYNLINGLAQHDIHPDVLAKLTLTEFLTGLGIDLGKGLKQVLIIDQFEELFSTHQESWQKREDFFRQLAQAMQDFPHLWAVLVMREDYIAYLDPYLYLLPGKLRVRYYMQRLSHEAALEAVKRPATKANRPFAKGVAEKLVNDLSSVKVRKPDETLETQIGQYVEPVQLQVVCSSLWEKLPVDSANITQEHVYEYVGDVNQALGNYYNSRVQTVAEGEEAVKRGVKERDIREWFGRKLITADGIRNLVVQEPGRASGGLDDDVIQQFVKRGDLVHTETRGSVTFYELTHDRLVEPILADNRKWEQAHTSVLQRQAALWDQQGRSEGLLLRGQELEDIEKGISTTSLTKIEQDFLSACRKLKAQEERERRQRRLVTLFSIVATLAFLVAVFFGMQSNQNVHQAQTANTQSAQSLSIAHAASTLAVEQRNRAQDLAEKGLANQLAGQSKAQLNNNYDLALLLGIEAYRLEKDLPEARSNLLGNLNSPNLISVLSPHKGTVKDLDFSPDGKMLASGNENDTIILWDVSNLQAPAQLAVLLSANAKGVESVTFSPDGKTLASGDWKEIILWDVSDPSSPKRREEPLVGHTKWVQDIAFSPDGKTLASASRDKTIILWDVASGQPIGQPLQGHKDVVNSITFSADGKILASGSWDNTIILWNVSDPKSPTQLGKPLAVHTDAVNSVAFSPDGKILASGSNDKTIILWDVSDPSSPTPLLKKPLAAHTDVVNSVTFSSDGKTLASSSQDQTIRLWDVSDPRSPKPQGGRLSGHASWVEVVAFSPDNKTLASGSQDQTIRLWEVSNPRAPTQIGGPLLGHTDDAENIAFSPDGKILAAGGWDNTIILWNVSEPESPIQLSTPLSAHTNRLEHVTFSPDGKILASAGWDNTIILWDVSNPEAPAQLGKPLAVHTDPIESVAFSPNGKLLASGSDDKTIILWDVSDPKSPTQLGAPLDLHTDAVQSVAFSPDGKILASGSDDDTIILWDVSDPKSPTQLSTLSGHTDDAKVVAFNPNGKLLASGSDDSTVILWDVSDPKSPTQLGAPLSAPTRDVNSVAFSPDGKMLASGSWEEIILWDVTNPSLPFQLGKPFTGHAEWVLSVAFSPKGRILASGGKDFTVRLWDINADSWLRITCNTVGRNLTKAEWARYLPNQAYRVTCPQWPAGQ